MTHSVRGKLQKLKGAKEALKLQHNRYLNDSNCKEMYTGIVQSKINELKANGISNRGILREALIISASEITKKN